jgi:DNA-binding LacI/PurR family transcriptional regulator
MTSAFSQTGKLCLPIIWNDSEKSSRDSLRKLMKQNPASLIVDIGFYNSLEEIVAISKKTPKCLIGFRSPQEIREYPAVFVDNVAMFTEGIKFLLNRGHKKILILGHNLDLLPTQHAILETVAENLGLEFPSETLLYATHGDFGTDYEERVRDMFNAENPPTAAFGFADYVTWKFTQDLKELYPKHQFQDLIGVHNTEWSRQQGQEFHTFYIPHDKIFAKAIKILNEQADKTTLEWVKPKFIIREK